MSATTIPQLSAQLQSLFTTEADQLARDTGCVQRARKLTGSVLAQSLVFGQWAHPHGTFAQHVFAVALQGVTVSESAVQQHLHRAASDFMAALLARAVQLGLQIEADPVAVPLLQRFAGVYLQDSSLIALVDPLREAWPGYQADDAALKLQVCLDYATGKLHLAVSPGRTSDHTLPEEQETFPVGALLLRDLGYFVGRSLRDLAQQGVYWLTHVPHNTAIFTADGQRWALLDLLQAHEAAGHAAHGFTLDVRFGVDCQQPCRLLARRVPRRVAARLQQRLYAEARDKGETVSAERVALTRWVVFLTNVPPGSLSLEEAWVLARVRWQIELLFKVWKSVGHLDDVASSHTAQPYALLCELYGRLLAMLLQHWVCILSLWRCPDRSLLKAAQRLREHALALLMACADPAFLQHVLNMLIAALPVSCRVDRRGADPATWQLLLALTPSSPCAPT